MKVHFLSLICSCMIALLIVSSSSATAKPIVFVSILPQKFFVQQLAGDLVEVEVMVKPGASPATYEPKPSQMAKLSSSVVYLAVGVPFEKNWLEKFSAVNSGLKIIHTEQGIDKISMAEHLHDSDRSADHAEEHSSENQAEKVLDPHVWLSPNLVKKQTKIIADVLAEIIPEHTALIEKNYRTLIDNITTLDGELRELFRDKQQMQFLVFHPSWGYFAREYGLQQVAIEMEGKEPKPAQLLEIIAYAREHDIRVIFVQRQFSAKSAKVIAAEISGRVVAVDPLAENWFANIREVAEHIHAVVK